MFLFFSCCFALIEDKNNSVMIYITYSSRSLWIAKEFVYSNISLINTVQNNTITKKKYL